MLVLTVDRRVRVFHRVSKDDERMTWGLPRTQELLERGTILVDGPCVFLMEETTRLDFSSTGVETHVVSWSADQSTLSLENVH
ncbi:unnamed protein product [Cyprideis torosa]|uniref:Uncharacterized protein n=1 Tax=Cyprideis torosa TaxID=163714 RepID=A0A7R8W959_9CRUS|nr:unnamed protein product [Cyprideis torosa]CAG0889427.1 unnamed protein product [Cyprideis torosa]